MAKDAIVSEELAKKFSTEKDTPYLRWVRARRSRHHQRPLRAQSAHRRAQALGAARRLRRLHQSRGVPHLQRLLRLRDPAGQEARAPAPAVRGDDPGARRPRLHHGVERRGQAHHLRVEERGDVRHPAQLLAPALQRLRPGAGALRLRDQRAAGDQSLRGRRVRLQHQARFQEPLQRRARVFQRQGRAEGSAAGDQLRRRTRSTCR